MKRKLSPPHLRPSSKLGVPDYSSREARESFLEDQHAPQAKVRFNSSQKKLPLFVCSFVDKTKSRYPVLTYPGPSQFTLQLGWPRKKFNAMKYPNTNKSYPLCSRIRICFSESPPHQSPWSVMISLTPSKFPAGNFHQQ